MISLLPLLLACTECAPLRGLPVFDPDDLIPASREADLQEAAAEYAAWTGRETVCVPGVEIVGRDRMEWAGLFQGSGRPIHLREDLAVTSVLRHELTHALDALEDLVVDSPRSLPERGIDPALYGTPHARSEERLARLAEQGPRADTVLAQEVAAACGLSLGPDHAGHAFVQERLWRGWDDRPLRTPGPDVAAGEVVWNDAEPDPYRARVLRGLAVGDWTVRVQWLPRGAPLDGHPRIAIGDRWTGAVERVTAWPVPMAEGPGAEVLPDLALIPGVHEGAAVVWLLIGRLDRRAWRLDLETGALVEAPPPGPIWTPNHRVLAVHEDRTVVRDDGRLRVVTREGHAELPLTGPTDIHHAIGMALDDGVLRLLLWDGADLALDLETGVATEGPVAAPAYDGWAGEAWDPDAGRWLSSVDLHDLAEPHRALVTLDPETGAWALPADPCATLSPVAEYRGLHQGADGAWQVRWTGDGDGRTLQEARPLRVVGD